MLPSVDLVYSVAKGVFSPWLRWGLRWTIEGADNVPATGPALLASNHVSYLDPLTLAWVADRRGRHVRFLAKAELFDKRGLGPLLRAAHQIPVQRGKVDAADALHEAVAALERGECIAVFPEGTISQDLEPMAGKSGTARLAHRAGVPIVPVGLAGTFEVWPRSRIIPVAHPIRIHYGRAIFPEDLAGMETEAITALIRERLLECRLEANRGLRRDLMS